MNKKKFSFDIVTDEDGKVRLENVQHKKVAPKLSDALNKAIGEIIRAYNFNLRVKHFERGWTNREETRRLIALGLNPKTRDVTLLHHRDGRYFMFEGYKTVDEIISSSAKKRPRIMRRWSRELLDSMLTPYEERGRLYVARTVEKSVSEIEERVNDGTLNDAFLKRKRRVTTNNHKYFML